MKTINVTFEDKEFKRLSIDKKCVALKVYDRKISWREYILDLFEKKSDEGELRRLVIERKNKITDLREKAREKAIKLFNKGMSYRKIAKEISQKYIMMSHVNVLNIIKKYKEEKPLKDLEKAIKK